MIKDTQKTETISPERSPNLPKGIFPALHPRQMRAIEIAEGALLADIGVIFHLLTRFIPIIGQGFLVLIAVIFAVIVLRRGFYTGCMSLCVALFVVCIVVGPGGLPFFMLSSGAGLFLGLTMRLRLNQFVTCVVGVLGGGGALWLVLLFYGSLAGGVGVLLRGLHQSYASFTTLAGLLFKAVGLSGFWLSWLFPRLDTFMQWGFQHWLLLYYLLTCGSCIPVVPGVYFAVNFFLRILGYQVRPFPGYLLEGWLLALASGLLALIGALLTFVSRLLTPVRLVLWSVSKRGPTGQRVRRQPEPIRLSALSYLKREVRRLNIARLHQQRLEREGRRVEAYE